MESSFLIFQGGSTPNLNMNLYATKKTVAEGMLDVALFLANITHMKTVIEQGAGYRYEALLLLHSSPLINNDKLGALASSSGTTLQC